MTVINEIIESSGQALFLYFLKYCYTRNVRRRNWDR